MAGFYAGAVGRRRDAKVIDTFLANELPNDATSLPLHVAGGTTIRRSTSLIYFSVRPSHLLSPTSPSQPSPPTKTSSGWTNSSLPSMATANLELSPFLDLPAELRITIYGIIIDTAPAELAKSKPLTDANIVPHRVPTSFDLLEYSGFIISCKQIMEEFQSEWLPKFNDFVQAINAVSLLLHVPCVSTISHSIRLQICVGDPEHFNPLGPHWPQVTFEVERIFRLLPFFTLARTGHSLSSPGILQHLPGFFYRCTDDKDLGMQLGQSEDGHIVTYAWKEMMERGVAGGKRWRDLYWFDLSTCDMEFGPLPYSPGDWTRVYSG